MFLFPPLERISDAYPYLFYGDLLSQVPTDSETYSYYTPPAVTYYDSYPESSEIYHEIDSFETVYHESPQTYHDSPHTYHDSPHTYHDNSPSYHRESFPTSYHTSGYHDHGYHNHGYHDHHGHQEHHHSSYSSSIGGGGYHADFSDAPGFATKKPDAEETPTVEKETPGRFSYSGTFYTNNHGEIEFEELRLQPINHLKTNQQKDEPNSSGSNTAEQNDTRDNSLQKVASEIDTTGKAAKLDISY